MVDYRVEDSSEGMKHFISYIRCLESGRRVEIEFPYRHGQQLDTRAVSETLALETGRIIEMTCKDIRANPPTVKLTAIDEERPKVERIEDFLARQGELVRRVFVKPNN